MKFTVTIEAADQDPYNESADYIADTAPLEVTVEADSTFDALRLAAAPYMEARS